MINKKYQDKPMEFELTMGKLAIDKKFLGD